MEKKLTVLITGATSGFGEACAKRFAQDGAHLIIIGRREQRLFDLANQLASPVHAIPLDVRDRSAVEKVVTELPLAFQDVDVLINNAGLALGIEPAHQTSLDNWDQMIETNCRGLVTVTRALLPGMVERNRGHIFNIGSVAGSYPYPGGNVYGATKAFVHQFSLNLKADLLGTAIRVTCIEPGMAETEFSLVRLKNSEKAKKVYEGMQPLTAFDIANAIHWCATLPAHVNVNRMELMPVTQSFSAFSIDRS